jgi:hypothetical protein
MMKVRGLGGGASSESTVCTVAEYPAFSIALMTLSVVTVSGMVTLAIDVARLTVAVTESMLLSVFSTRATHEAQVIP